MTNDSPGPPGGGRALPKKPGSPSSAAAAAALLEEQRRELEKLRAELEAERARGRAERRRFGAKTRQLRDEAERGRQQLADHLRSKGEAQRVRELRQLREAMLREREVEIRQLLRWKEAELRQLQQLLHRERDSVVRQARELQRQLAEELVHRGHGGGSEAPDVAAARCRCRLQEVLSQLRWDTDGEQAARIRHLQAALDVERQLFLEYILEHFRVYPALPELPDPQAVRSSEEAPLKTEYGARRSPESSCGLGFPECLSTGARIRSRSLDLVGAACPGLPEGRTPTRAGSLDSLAPARSRSADTTQSHPKAPGAEKRASSPDISIPGSSSLEQPISPRVGEGAESRPSGDLTPLPSDPDHRELVKQNSELAEALQALARRCSGLRQENTQLRRSGFLDDADVKVKLLKVKNAELAGLARRLEDRARKLQETNLRALSAPLPGQSRAGLELCHVLTRQRAQELEEQASALLAKDKEIEELRHECHLLQSRVGPGLGSCPLPGRGVPGAQWLSVSDMDRLLRESQREVLRLQKQLTVLHGRGGSRAEAGVQSAPYEEGQMQELERELGARRRECQELGAQVAAARRRGDEAEEQLRAALRDGAWLAEENARLQAQADWVRKVAAESNDVRGQLDRACRERDAASLLADQLLREAARGQDRQQQLQRDLQKARLDLQIALEEMWALQRQPGHPPEEPQGATQDPREHQTRDSRKCNLQPGPGGQILSQPGWDKQQKAEASRPENLVVPGGPDSVPQAPARVPDTQLPESRSLAKKSSSQSTSSSEMESVWATVPSCSAVDTDTASEVDNLEPDTVTPAPETGDSQATTVPKVKLFLARYSYNPFEGPNEQPEGELPLVAGDYVYVFGNMDEDGFYQGKLEDGQQGLVPSNLVEHVLDCCDLGCIRAKSPESGPTLLPAGPDSATKEDTDHCMWPREAQGAADRGPGQVSKTGSRTQVAMDISAMETKPCWPDPLQSLMELGFSGPLLETEGPLCTAHMQLHLQLHLQGIAATWAEISWVSGSCHHPHVVYLGGQEHGRTPGGVSCYTFHGLRPGTRYQVRVEPRPPPGDLSQVCRVATCSTFTFATPLAGPPDPPLDVLVERHASPGLLVVSWLPVTIDSAGSSNGVRVTGYAVYADGLKVAEVADATAGSALLEASQLQAPPLCPKVSVRTTSLCGESLDSVPAQVPEDGFTCRPLPGHPRFGHTCGDPSTCSVTCPERPVLALPSAKASPRAPRICRKPQPELLEALPTDYPVPSPSSEGGCWNVGVTGRAQGPTEAWAVCKKDSMVQKSPQGPSEVGGKCHWDTGLVPLSPELGTGKEPCQEEEEEEKAAACLGPWRRERRTWRGQGQALGGRRYCRVPKSGSLLRPAPSSKVVGTCQAGPAWQLPACGHPRPLEVCLGVSSGLASHGGSLPGRPPPWTSEITRAALENDSRNRQSGAQAKGWQAPRAGDTVIEEGFY
ncbi:RIMS-binding protein 3A-like [Tamandua tetradactyla]|uniref:RIMS-binding protein 3A-like n=1 Tax=Tamandua tetradactyla TaxID=48850 RepID=UPI0040541556